MTLKVISIHEQGDSAKEYVVLEASTDLSLQYYILSDTTFTAADRISNKLRHVFWFPPKDIKAGDRVVVRTGNGTNDTYQSNGRTVHRFFWKLDSAVWNDEGDAAILFTVKTWKTTAA